MARLRRSLIARPVLWLLAAGTPVFLLNFFLGRPGISGWDANLYYSYAAAFAETGSLDLAPVFREMVRNGADRARFDANRRTATGQVFNYFPIGHPLLHTPAAALGAALSHLYEKNPGALRVTAQLFYCLSCIAAAALGLALMRKITGRLTDPESAAVALYTMAACSMLGYYWFILPALSHTSSLLMTAIIFALILKLAEAPHSGPGLWLSLGLAIGYNAAIRLQDAALAIAAAPLLWRLAAGEFPPRGTAEPQLGKYLHPSKAASPAKSKCPSRRNSPASPVSASAWRRDLPLN